VGLREILRGAVFKMSCPDHSTLLRPCICNNSAEKVQKIGGVEFEGLRFLLCGIIHVATVVEGL
jgi:hypothetical protein